MTLKDVMKQDAGTFLNTDEFGEPATYNGASIDAVVSLQGDKESGNTFSNEGQSVQAIISVACADVPSPEHGDTIVTADNSWQVARILSSDEAMHRLECIAEESPW